MLVFDPEVEREDFFFKNQKLKGERRVLASPFISK